MSERTSKNERERGVLVGVQRSDDEAALQSRLDEMVLLADTAGCDILGRLTQVRQRPDPKTYVGSGKVEEVKALVDEAEAEVVIFDADLSPAQARNLETALGHTVIDRTQLILDIFARRAQTRLARWEVELAQLQYELPRFRRMWTHLSRLDGGGVGTRGPGETQLEVDRRRARERIHLLQQRLKEAERQKDVAGRARAAAFNVALVGYTNVGKSSLMNALTGAEVFIEDRLFATLDATTRRLEADGEELLLTDTVGFIRALPHHLVASFHATLSEVLDADLLLHVADISSPELAEQVSAVHEVLKAIGADSRPQLMVFNKADALPDDLAAEAIAERHGGGQVVSAHTGAGLDELCERLVVALRAQHRRLVLAVPYTDSRTMAYLEANAKILDRSFGEAGTRVTALLAPADAGRLKHYLVEAETD